MRIGELSQRSGVSASRIRFYEEQGLLPPADRAQNGYRDYGEAALDRLETISLAQRLGFSLAEIKAFTPDPPSKATAESMLARLKDKLADVERHLSDALALKQRLIAAVELFEKAAEQGVVCGGGKPGEKQQNHRCLSEAVDNAPRTGTA